MTTVPINETRMFIEDALSCVAYAESMIRLAGQHRREGNHAAANGALMTAWIIRENTAEAIEVLPNLTREHAAMLGRSERQRLATELNSCYENLNRMGEEHDPDASQWDEFDEPAAEWYMSCFEVGLAAHLANTIAVRAESLPQSEAKIKIARLAVVKCFRAARESMEYARKNEPAAHVPFPKTRQQTMERALSNHDELERLDQQLQEKMDAAKQEADNSLGRCDLCGAIVRAGDVSAHAMACVMAAFQGRSVENGRHSRYADNGAMLIWVRSTELRHWMLLAARPSTSLRNLDQFLRDQWLECCGHMSHFEIGLTRYCAGMLESGDTQILDTDTVDAEDRHMAYTLAETLELGERARHVFDYDNITEVDFECVTTLDALYDVLAERLIASQGTAEHDADFIIVARNLPLATCFTCGATARWRYHTDPYVPVPPEDGGPIVDRPYFCDDCSPDDLPLIALRNSPRAGVSCYDNAHSELEPESEAPQQQS